MNREIASRIAPLRSISPQVLSAAANGVVIDLLGYDAVCAVITTGAIVSAGDFGVKLQHGNASDGSDAVDVTAVDVVSNAPATLAADSVYKISYLGTRRYLRVVATKAGGTSIALGAVIVGGHPAQMPT